MEWIFFAIFIALVLGGLFFATYRANGHVISWSRTLEDRRVTQGSLRLIESVVGRRRERMVRLTTSPGGRHRLAIEADGVGALSFHDRGVIGELARLLQLKERFIDQFKVRADGKGARQLENTNQISGEDLERCITAALAAARALRVPELRFEDGWLIAHGIQGFESARVTALTEAMIDLAEAFSGAAALGARVRAASRDLRVCPFCRDGLDDEVRACEDCQAAHHQDCWDEHGGCSIFGCRGAARPRSGQREAVT